MVQVKEKIASELDKVSLIWKELVNNRQQNLEKISDVFNRYKMFLEENKSLFKKESGYFREIEIVEAQLSHYNDVCHNREKKNLLNDAYIGLILDVSESMEVLKNKMEELSLSSSGHTFFN